MPTLIRAFGLGLLVLACLFTIGGLADDATGLVVIAELVVGVAVYALLGARREEEHRRRIADREPR